MMALDRVAAIGIYRNANRLARFRRAPFRQHRAMNENVSTLLSIRNAQLANFRSIMSRHMKQSPIADLPAHLGIKWRTVENDVDFVRIFSRKNGFDNCLRLQEIVSEEFR